MNTMPVFKPLTETPRAKVIDLALVVKKIEETKPIKYNKDGSVNKSHSNKVAGVSSEVYPFSSESEIKSMIDTFNKYIDEATNNSKKQIACRNKMLFLVGINLGIRASDLCGLKYSFFMNNDGTFKDGYSLQPKKTKKSGKYVKLYFNQTVKKAIADYLAEYPMMNMDEYLFKSKKGGAITEKSLWKIIVNTAIDAGIDYKNVGTHSLRKTFGYHIWHNAEDKEKALVMLMAIFNHSSVATTKKYIGIMDEEIEDVFNNLNLGLDFLDN